MSEERETACYNQNCEQFRSMNQIMWQVPVLAMTLTGGLWFGAGQLKDYTVIKVLLFVLAACSDIAFFVVLMRIRFVMGAYLKKIEEFHPMSFVKADGTGLCRSKMVVHTFSRLRKNAEGRPLSPSVRAIQWLRRGVTGRFCGHFPRVPPI